YCNFGGNEEDLFEEMLAPLGFEPRPCSRDELANIKRKAIINCVGVSAARLAKFRTQRSAVVITDQDNRGEFAANHSLVTLPTSFQILRRQVDRSIASVTPSSAFEAVMYDPATT